MKVQEQLKLVSVCVCFCLLEGDNGRDAALGLNNLLKQQSFFTGTILRK